MGFKSNHDLKDNLHPYTFALKEGAGIRNDYLDYSLLMLHMGASETIQSPKSRKKVKPFPFIAKLPFSPRMGAFEDL